MNMQALLIRAAVMTAMCVGLSVAMAYRHPVAQTLPQTKAVAAEVHLTSSRMEPEPFVLPTVTVRPTAAEMTSLMAEQNEDPDESPSLSDEAAHRTLYDSIAPALPNVRLDMPYYSFGKALPRVSKE